MIRVELVGGAKKLFAQNVININKSKISISDLFVILQDMQIKDSAKLDLRNTLVAINGADTSATGGISSIVHENDVVSIIPVIHGGNVSRIVSVRPRRIMFKIKRRRFNIIGIKRGDSIGASFLDILRKSHPKVKLQIISARFVLNETHAKKILFLSAESEKRNIMLANRIETDILMRFALTTQISVAIKDAGMQPLLRHVLISTGPARSLDLLYDSLCSNLTELFTVNNTSFLKRRFKITQKMITATTSDTPLEDILAEKAAVLSSDLA